MRLADRTAVVTGASSGLGRAMARAFVREGATTVCLSRTRSTLEATTGEFADLPGEAVAMPADVRSRESVRSMVERTMDAHGPVDVLVDNAGVYYQTVTGEAPALAHEISVDVWDAVIATHVRGSFLCTKAVLPAMLDRGAGRVVFVSSGMEQSGRARRSAYCVAKIAIEGLAESVARELDSTSGVSAVLFRPPDGGVYTANLGAHGRTRDSFAHDPSVVEEAAVRLAAGEGLNGGRYVATADGAGFETYDRRG